MGNEHASGDQGYSGRDALLDLITSFCDGVEAEFNERWSQWPVDLATPGPTEVTAGLLRRQVTLARTIAQNPGLWTPAVAPILLRSMVEVHIWLAWILLNPVERSRKFIDDGLGKEKLILKHRADEIVALNGNPDEDALVCDSKNWIESQRYSFMIDVNLSGSWSGLDTREMAAEADLRDFYRFTYPVWSTAVHSTWNCISRYELRHCGNPLHAHHLVPNCEHHHGVTGFLWLAAKYLDKSFRLVDTHFGFRVATESTYGRMFEGDASASDEGASQ